jgi:hypothetical protein
VTAPAYGEMHDELAQFEAALHEAARAIVLEVLTAEYTRRIAAGEGPIADQDEDEVEVEAPAPAAAPEAAPAVATPVAPGSSSSERRGRWTHASVIDELCTWLLGGSAVEASYLRRHGAPGLVSAAKRLFGRFEAALNAANLVLAQRYPDGPPSRRAQQRMAARDPRIGQQRRGGRGRRRAPRRRRSIRAWREPGTSASDRDQITVSRVRVGWGAASSRWISVELSNSSLVGAPKPIALTSVPLCGEPRVIRLATLPSPPPRVT